jgi:hypothetical protein
MTAVAAPCYMRQPIGFAIVTYPGWRLGLLAVSSRGLHKYFGWPHCDPAAERIVVDRDYVFALFKTEAGARAALAAVQPQWDARDRAGARKTIGNLWGDEQ